MCFIVVMTFQALAAAGSHGWILLTYPLETFYLSSFRTVLLVKYKLEALLLRVLIRGALREFILK